MEKNLKNYTIKNNLRDMNEEIRKKIHEICKKNSIDESLFYIASIGTGKKIVYDFRNKKEEIKEKFIIRYFSRYDRFVIWNRIDHGPTTKIMSLCMNDFNDCIENRVLKGVEFRWKKSTKVYVSNLKDLEKTILECVK